MSTFDGNVVEFPDIQVDHFRRDPSRPSVAFFLTHVHSDHLQGLESFKGSFIYCSFPTREILLRLEKYPHRMNFAKGILESRVQTYKHLRTLLKPIPLETPTAVELAPGRSIRVTLFDANHCVGAVMFLIEGDGKAILYTGDIRSEAWWVNSLIRTPLLLPFVYSDGQTPLKRLDNIYLDTTFAVKENRYRKFPSKAEGITELLRKVSGYSRDTKFYFDSWTFGYEEVWQALSNFLETQIHVDDYRYGLYLALAHAANSHSRPPEAFKLIGSNCGNHLQEGCLTTRQTRLHSCERGTDCEIWKQKYVRITPIVSRYQGVEIAEVGAGGGQGDLNPQHVLELGDPSVVQRLTVLCATQLKDHPCQLGNVTKLLSSTIEDPSKKIFLETSDLAEISLDLQETDLTDSEPLPIGRLISALVKQASKGSTAAVNPPLETISDTTPQRITFPYSRHSSYDELCLLIEAFRPRNIHPCTVDEQTWDPTLCMSNLFGQYYDEDQVFRHDRVMLAKHSKKRRRSSVADGIVETDHCHRVESPSPSHSMTMNEVADGRREKTTLSPRKLGGTSTSPATPDRVQTPPDPDGKRFRPPKHETRVTVAAIDRPPNATEETSLYDQARLRYVLRQDAYDAALGHGKSWFDIGLVSVHGHQDIEEELGVD